MNEKTTILLVLICGVVGCVQQPPESQSASKPVHDAPSYVSEQELVQTAIATLEAAGLVLKYNVIQPFYAQTPSQMGDDFVGFTLGPPRPDADGFVRLHCIIPVNSLRRTAGRPKELSDEDKKVFVRFDENGKVTGFKTDEPHRDRTPQR